MDLQKCEEFLADTSRNPITRRTITFKGKKYNEIMAACEKYIQQGLISRPQVNQPTSSPYIPPRPRKSTVPSPQKSPPSKKSPHPTSELLSPSPLPKTKSIPPSARIIKPHSTTKKPLRTPAPTTKQQTDRQPLHTLSPPRMTKPQAVTQPPRPLSPPRITQPRSTTKQPLHPLSPPLIKGQQSTDKGPTSRPINFYPINNRNGYSGTPKRQHTLATNIIKPGAIEEITNERTNKGSYEIFNDPNTEFAHVRHYKKALPNFSNVHIYDFITTSHVMTKKGANANVIPIIMCELSSEEVYDLIASLLGFDMNGILSIDQCYNLLGYLRWVHMGKSEKIMGPLSQYFNSYDTEVIRQCLGPNYKGQKDPVSIIFAFVTGKTLPDNIIPNSQYHIMKQIPPCIASHLSLIGIHMKIKPGERYLFSPPYIHISEFELSKNIMPIVLSLRMDNVDNLMQKYEVILSPWNKNPYSKIQYFLEEILLYYDDILTRDENIGPPPDIDDANIENIRNILKKYTLKEISDAYDPGYFWTTRDQLIDVIIDESSTIPKWRLRNRYCNNDNTRNASTLVLHGHTKKNNLDNITLSYGVRGNYRCYQVDELIDSFREYDGVFRFIVPDWTNESINPHQRIGPIDPATGLPLPEEFPRESITKLYMLIGLIRYHILDRDERVPKPGDYIMSILHTIIGEGLRKRSDKSLSVLKYEYNTFSPEEQDLINLYLAWVFICSMWMRFWLGPKHSWADVRLNMADEKSLAGRRCVPTKREKHIDIQRYVYNILMGILHTNVKILQWVNLLPELSYNFETNIITVQPNLLNDVLRGIFFKNACMGYGGDQLIQSSYGIITSLHPDIDFTQYIAKYYPEISEIEKKVVEELLQKYSGPDPDKWTKEMMETLRERQVELSGSIPDLRTFIPGRVQYNPHTA